MNLHFLSNLIAHLFCNSRLQQVTQYLWRSSSLLAPCAFANNVNAHRRGICHQILYVWKNSCVHKFGPCCGVKSDVSFRTAEFPVRACKKANLRSVNQHRPALFWHVHPDQENKRKDVIKMPREGLFQAALEKKNKLIFCFPVSHLQLTGSRPRVYHFWEQSVGCGRAVELIYGSI